MTTSVLPSDLAAEVLSRGHRVRMRAAGGSMRPWIRPNQTVTLVPLQDPPTLIRGQVVLALCDGRPTLHRIVAVDPHIRTKGDSLSHLDPSPSQILGIMDGSGTFADRSIAFCSLALMPVHSLLVRAACFARAGFRRRPSP